MAVWGTWGSTAATWWTITSIAGGLDTEREANSAAVITGPCEVVLACRGDDGLGAGGDAASGSVGVITVTAALHSSLLSTHT